MLKQETLQELSEILHEEYKQKQNWKPQEIFDVAHNLVGLFDCLVKLDFKDKNGCSELDSELDEDEDEDEDA